ncbi:DHH family phosphoesterase [Anaerocolumna aminovalerica]|uniref:DHH family phosphoesterase n=1 Tax=Anaerocolumna aminovalerica TaxID=1527 RepID=UPI001C0F0DFB|nr:DHH family phosphoesterase [Anaerocolumna aminovalerica]MBU5331717.1 DHH family phosphoesterase [Anaerocolumna aminovalerica]
MSYKYKVLGKVRFGNEIEDILRLKGITNINSFLNPTKDCVEDELLLDNIATARDILVDNIEKNNVINLLVDCDCDGYSSAALMYQYIKKINPEIKINYYIHKDKVHGLSDVVEEMCLDESKLIIVSDAGTGDIVECSKLISHGKNVIILDHHSISSDGNPAIVVNNQLSDRITDKAMTGVGIVYKFTKVLDKYYGVKYADDYLDLLAFGMIGDRADMMNLQTRYLILEGLKQIRNKTGKNKLLRTLVDAQMYSMNNKVTINGIGFYVNPLVNSLIRLGTYEDKKYMFEALCNSDKMLERKVRGKGIVIMTIQEYVLKACESSNRKQRKMIEESANILSEEIEKNKLDQFPIIVCNAKDEVDKNSTGLIANKLADKYQRPCLLMRRKGDMCSGSGRGYDKCEILDFNQWCKDTGLFSMVDGHPGAFGCKISYENTYKLFTLLSTMNKIDEPIYHVYNVYDAGNLHDQIIRNIAKYDFVWGNTVTEPLFLIKDIPCNKYNIFLIGSKQNKIEFKYHNIKFTKQTRSNSLNALYKDIVTTGENIKFNVIGRFAIDARDHNCPQVIIEDMIFEKSNIVHGFGV